MSLTREDPALERPIGDRGDLIDYFRSGEKPRGDWRVGTEHEKLGLYRDSLEPVPYEGPRGIRALLEKLASQPGFAPLEDGGNVVGLEHDGASITLEPGGQLELSGAPFATLHETCREFRDHIALLKHASEEFGIEWLGLGIHPMIEIADCPRVPRERYGIMRSYLPTRGERALEMMHLTATVQANFDYASERDFARKLRLGHAVGPVVTALYANSSISSGGPNGFLSRRAWIWRAVDPDRCGILPFVFADDWLDGAAYDRYTEWALDVPMFFLERGGKHLELDGRSFRTYMQRGFGEAAPSVADWNLHLTTLFPEARLKRIIEVRSADGVPPGLVCGLPAFWKGLLYDEEALDAALARVARWSFEQVDRLDVEVAREGLWAMGPDGPVAEVARELVDLSAAGLRRIGVLNRAGEDESLFLEPIFEILDRNASPGRQLLDRWRGAWHQRLDLLVEYARY